MADETSPLLGQSASGDSSPSRPEATAAPSGTSPAGLTPETAAPRSNSPLYPSAIIYLFVFCFVADLGGALLNTPELRLLEMAVCRDYYHEHDPAVIGEPPNSYIDEKLCKVKEIQASLAYLLAAKSLLSTIPGILLTFPYGRLSDKIGRKTVMYLGLLGQILAIFWVIFICYYHQIFFTKLVLISPVFLIIGGGNQVMTATMYAIVADVSPEQMRTTIFYLMGAGILITNIFSVPIGSWLLSIDLWLPFKFSIPIILTGFPLILLMPETLAYQKHRLSEDYCTDGPENLDSSPQVKSKLPSILQDMLNSITIALKELASASQDKGKSLCLLIIFINALARMSGGIFIQYASKVLSWSIATIGYILSINGLVMLCVLVALAGITQLIERQFGTRPLRLDIYVTHLSLALHALGAICIAFSRDATLLIIGSILGSAGNGVIPALQGILASFTDGLSTGQLFAASALLELIAQLAGSFIFAKFFDVGLSIEAPWGVGIPFFASAALYILAGLLSFLLPTISSGCDRDRPPPTATTPNEEE